MLIEWYKTAGMLVESSLRLLRDYVPIAAHTQTRSLAWGPAIFVCIKGCLNFEGPSDHSSALSSTRCLTFLNSSNKLPTHSRINARHGHKSVQKEITPKCAFKRLLLLNNSSVMLSLERVNETLSTWFNYSLLPDPQGLLFYHQPEDFLVHYHKFNYYRSGWGSSVTIRIDFFEDVDGSNLTLLARVSFIPVFIFEKLIISHILASSSQELTPM